MKQINGYSDAFGPAISYTLVRIDGKGWYKLCGEQQHSSLIPRSSHVHAALCLVHCLGKKSTW